MLADGMTSPRQAAVVAAILVLTWGCAVTARAQPAPNPNAVLILDTTVAGGAGSLEATEAAALGLTPVVVSASTWSAMTASDFQSYRAIVLGDPNCGVVSSLAPAVANRATWGPQITGNVILIGTDPAVHPAGGKQLTSGGIKFAAAGSSTGAYITLSCYYVAASAGTAVPLLDPFGSFTVVGQNAERSHVVAAHPALSGLSDAILSNWGNSTHEGFQTWAPSFNPLVISLDIPSSFVASDGTTGAPYVLARGVAPIGCGDGKLTGDEECDDGNKKDGDGCSSTCRKEPPVACEGKQATRCCQFGACCVGTSCVQIAPRECEVLGGIYFGDHSSCMVGACCLGDKCVTIPASECAKLKGKYLGDGSKCGSCPITVPDGHDHVDTHEPT